MTYIIDPKWFYWLNTIENIKSFTNVSTILLGCAIVLIGIVGFIAWMNGVDYGHDDSDYKHAMRLFKILKKMIPVLIILAIAAVFIPNKNTLIEMQVAKIATVENVEWTVDSIKEVVNYIVESMAKLK